MANTVYPKAKEAMISGLLNLSSGGAGVGVLLVGTGYTYNGAHEFVSDVSAQELSHASYSRKALGSRTVAGGVFDAADAVWTAINAGTAKAAIIYQEGASDSARRLVAYIDTATGVNFPVVYNGGDWELRWDDGANKIFAV
jgi:hypothetical protein